MTILESLNEIHPSLRKTIENGYAYLSPAQAFFWDYFLPQFTKDNQCDGCSPDLAITVVVAFDNYLKETITKGSGEEKVSSVSESFWDGKTGAVDTVGTISKEEMDKWNNKVSSGEDKPSTVLGEQQ